MNEQNSIFSKWEIMAGELRWRVKHQLDLLEASLVKKEVDRDYEVESYAQKSEMDIHCMSVVPLLVSVFETFFQQFLNLYVNHSPKAEETLKKMTNRRATYTFLEFEEVRQEHKTLADLYFSKRENSFQNLENLENQYKKFVDVKFKER